MLLFLAAITLPTEVWASVATAILAAFGWLGKAHLDGVKQQRETYKEFLGEQKISIEKVTEALVQNSNSLNAITARLGDLCDSLREDRRERP